LLADLTCLRESQADSRLCPRKERGWSQRG